MRRFFLPAVVLVVVIVASVLTGRANDAADPDDPEPTDPVPSLGTPLLNVRRAPEWLRQPTNDTILAGAVRGAIAGVDDANPRCVSVRRDGEPIIEIDPAASLVPGYLQRLATLAAFDTLGSQGFTTDVVRDSAAEISEGVLGGDLWLVGGADPVLSTDAYISRFGDDRARTSIEDLAEAVVAALAEDGITTIAGSVVGDDTKYEGGERVYSEETWTSADVASNVVGPISALLLDNGFDAFPDEVDPPANSRASNPARHAAERFTDLLEAGGIVVEGSPTVGVQPEAVNREPVASISSPPIIDIARRALLDGTTAEMLFRELAVRSGFEATQVAALLTVSAQLTDAGVIEPGEVNLAKAEDGSGLSGDDRNTCGILADILDLGDDSLAAASLPPIGQGPLGACAPAGLDTLDVLASARDDVTAMAGRAVASNGDELAFVVIVNWATDPDTGAAGPESACDGILPAVLDVIADHPGGPALEQLEPLPPVTNS